MIEVHKTDGLNCKNFYRNYHSSEGVLSDETILPPHEPQYDWTPKGTSLIRKSDTYNEKFQFLHVTSCNKVILFSTLKDLRPQMYIGIFY